MDLSKYAAVLLDLDGTLYHEETALPGAARLVGRLQARGQTFACLSNSASSPAELTLRLAQMGMVIKAEHIWTAAAAACEYVLEHFPAEPTRKPRVFSLATEGVRSMLDGRVEWVEPNDTACDVVLAAAPVSVYATEDRRRAALRLLRSGAKLVGVCADRVYPSPRGIEFGSGAFNAMLAYAADVRPIFCGKPEPVFFTELCDHLKVAPSDCVLIGDNLESDIAGARRMGMASVLVLTGVTRREDLALVPEEKQPDFVVEDLNALVDSLRF